MTVLSEKFTNLKLFQNVIKLIFYPFSCDFFQEMSLSLDIQKTLNSV